MGDERAVGRVEERGHGRTVVSRSNVHGVPVPAEIVELLRGLGATEDEIEMEAAAERLAGFAVDLVFRSRGTRTPGEVAGAIGVDEAFVIEAYRLLGIPLRPDDAVLGDADIALLRGAVEGFAAAGMSTGDDMLRVVATSLSRIADAVTAMYVQQVESQFDHVPDLVGHVRTNAQATELALRQGEALGTLFVHHMRDATNRWRATWDGTSRATGRFAVGFVDLVGFTPLSRSLPTQQLVGLVSRFERLGFDIASAHGGRVVKHIGDEVMFSAVDADAGARIALDLVREFTPEVQPRGALAFGEVLTLQGDYYGPVVNLASRLTDGAVPGEVLVDASTAEVLRDTAAEPAGRRMLKGFDEPVTVFSLVG